MILASALSALTDTVDSLRLPSELIRQRVCQIQQDVLANSRYIREPNFTVIHPRDLEFLLGAYDERFFGGLCQRALAGWLLVSEWDAKECGVAGAAADSNCLESGTSAPRRRLARKPKYRMRTKPRGSTCSKKRRKNSSTGNVRSRFLFL
jgi:hypothetical protein